MEKKNEKNVFMTLSGIDMSNRIEQKNNLKYISWTWAWAEVKKHYPDATYEVWEDEHGRQWVDDETLGFMCRTTVTIQGESKSMWLPVMDGAEIYKDGERLLVTKHGWNFIQSHSIESVIEESKKYIDNL